MHLVGSANLATVADKAPSAKRADASGVGSSALRNRSAVQQAVDAELSGFLPPASISGYLRRLAGRDEPWVSQIDPVWWPRLHAAALGMDGRAHFRHPVDVVLAADALAEARKRSAQGVLPRVENDAVSEALVDELCKIVSRPMGVARDAGYVLTRLCEIDAERVISFARNDPLGVRVVRSLERALRLQLLNSKRREELVALIVTPSAERQLVRRTTWLRALRRCMVDDLFPPPGVPRAPNVKKWGIEQLSRAFRRDGSYEWITPAERRYAFWIADEFGRLPHDLLGKKVAAAFRELRSAALGDEAVAQFVGYLPQSQVNLGLQHRIDRVAMEWTDPWPVPPVVAKQFDRWVAENARTQWPTNFRQRGLPASFGELFVEVATTPCAIRFRMAVDAIGASGPKVRAIGTEALSRLTLDLLPHSGEPAAEPMLERCLLALGDWGHSESLQPLHHILRMAELTPTLRQTAIRAAGDVITRVGVGADPGGLAASVKRTAETEPDDATWIACVHAAASARISTRDWHRPENAHAPSPQVQEIERWALEVTTLLPDGQANPGLLGSAESSVKRAGAPMEGSIG